MNEYNDDMKEYSDDIARIFREKERVPIFVLKADRLEYQKEHNCLSKHILKCNGGALILKSHYKILL